MDAPHHTPADSPLVKALLKCYEQYTDYKGECLAIGGGTYVHDIPGGVAFGCCMPGFNGNMHGADEHTCIADQLTAAKIFYPGHHRPVRLSSAFSPLEQSPWVLLRQFAAGRSPSGLRPGAYYIK